MTGVPHNWETEMSLLGGILLDSRYLPDIEAILTADDFAREVHGALYSLLRELHRRDGAVDIISLLDHVDARKDADRFGGAAHLGSLPHRCPSTDNLEVYARRIRDHAVRRRLLAVLNRGIEAVGDPTIATDDVLRQVEGAVLDLGKTAADTTPAVTVGAVVGEVLRDLQARALNPQDVTGVATGFHDLDRITSGLHRTDLTILAARPAVGKTALALNIAANAARSGVGVAVFELEMAARQMAGRLLQSDGRVTGDAMRTGQMDGDTWARVLHAGDRVSPLPIWIDDRPGLTLAQIRHRARRLKHEHPEVGLVIIDYLQLMGAPHSGMDALAKTSHNSAGLKGLAKELDLPVLCLSQLSRALESRADKRPLPSDLRDSGTIEQDADNVLFIYRDEVYNDDSPDKGVAEVIIAKQRAGAIGKVRLAFLGQFQLFANLAGEPERERYY